MSNNLSGFRVSGCVDHFSPEEKEAFQHTRNIMSTLNFELPEEEEPLAEEPLYDSEQLLGLAPKEYGHSLDVKMVKKYSSHRHQTFRRPSEGFLPG